MNPLKSFDEFVKEGKVRKQHADISRSSYLADEAESRMIFLKEMKGRIALSDPNANYFVEIAYDVIMELVRARLLLDGFNASGAYAHEAEVAYLRNIGFSEADVRFVNELRYFRNGIVYYGKKLDSEYAGQVLEFLENAYPKLKQAVKK